jgi:hypothetical protein
MLNVITRMIAIISPLYKHKPPNGLPRLMFAEMPI